VVLVRLKGVHTIRAKLASGKVAVYHYAWKGGPRLPDDKGSPEFIAAFTQAHSARKQPKTGTLDQVVIGFRASAEFQKLSDHTKRAYRTYLDLIQAEFGDMPLRALDDPAVKGVFRDWRDGMRDTPRTADYAAATLRRVLAWGIDGGLFVQNHAVMNRLHSADRSESIWTEADFAAFAKHASVELMQAVELAAHTGLRQGDLIAMAWTNYDGESFQLRTSKRGRNVTIPATLECRALMKRIKKRQAVILTTHRGGRRWTADGLRASFRTVCKDAKVKRTFHDLRRTAATRLASLPGVSAGQIAMIMGWSEAEIEALKRRYVSRSAVVQSMLANMGEAE
jgi:integrase